MPHIFISHSSKDDLATDRLADTLTKVGLEVWVDHQKLDSGVANWEKVIREQSLPNSSALIFLMSENSLASKTCEAECLLAEELKIPIHVVELEKVHSSRIWLTVKLNHRAKLHENYDLEVAKLVAALQPSLAMIQPSFSLAKRTGEDVMRNTLGYSTDEVQLVGREEDVEAIEKLIGNHVLQVYAVGGTGKSRIAAEIATKYPTGMIWHRCSDYSHPSELLDLIRQHYQLPKEILEVDILATFPSDYR